MNDVEYEKDLNIVIFYSGNMILLHLTYF
jgi:hypothetical protein